jgi:hypothetical protein
VADLNSEAVAFAALLDALGTARDAMRSIALLRSDERWIATSSMVDQLRDNATKLMHRRPPVKTGTRLWLPQDRN